MTATIDKLTKGGCAIDDKAKVCRSRGGESCAFDGAMIVLQPIADTAHLVHAPIACCGNSWEGRGTLSANGQLHAMGFTTDMGEIDIVYGSEEKLIEAVRRIAETVAPKAIFVYSTCVSGLIGEDIDAVCRRAGEETGIRVIPVNAPGFAGPKNLGNRIAGEVLLEHVIGTGEPPVMTHTDVNLIGEYNIAGDLWLVEPLLAEAGIRILSRITGDSTFEEITWAHRAKLNLVVCGRALINVAREMERRYGIPYVEVSFFGSTETEKALRAIGRGLNLLNRPDGSNSVKRIETVIRQEKRTLKETLKAYRHLRGKKAVLYTGGVKSWSFISALRDLGIEVVAVGTKKSTAEDEEKMKQLLGPDAPLIEDVTPNNLKKLLKERGADMLIAGGRNRYLAVKEGCPFVDVNQERHRAYAGYRGLVNLAEDISGSMAFYRTGPECGVRSAEYKRKEKSAFGDALHPAAGAPPPALRINPLKHSPAVGAAMALQGIDGALPVIHGAQGCTFLGKVLLTRHFQEPIALASTRLFAEDVVMGSEERLVETVEGIIERNQPAFIGVLTSGLTEIKGDDVKKTVRDLKSAIDSRNGVNKTRILHIATPDFEGSLEAGYARAVEAIIASAKSEVRGANRESNAGTVNVLAGPHLTPADCNELREILEDFGMEPILLPDLSALDGSRQGISPLAKGGTTAADLDRMGASAHTIVLGKTLEPAARLLSERSGAPYSLMESSAGLAAADRLMQLLSALSGKAVPAKYGRQRRILIDGMRDAHACFAGKRICLALESDLAAGTSAWLAEMGALIELAVIPALTDSAGGIASREVVIGDLFSIRGKFDLLAAGSHGEATANRLGVPLYEIGFPVYKSFGYTSKITIGYRGTLMAIYDVANLLLRHEQDPSTAKQRRAPGSQKMKA